MIELVAAGLRLVAAAGVESLQAVQVVELLAGVHQVELVACRRWGWPSWW